ncbi:MAG TPA: AbrB/MazE/SpoVT family DNA-binding domain-containing protein [Burkholderiaceae bacterium]
MQITIRSIGNSQGFVVPKPLLAQVGLEGGLVDLTVENGALVLRKPAQPARHGWASAAQEVAAQGDDGLRLGEFGNQADADLVW